ncbi:MAG: hypothetical protein SVM80_12565, partial [Halobacteriota archaeon]|nr:hypothetical protein [Halobacteriota archaeon]
MPDNHPAPKEGDLHHLLNLAEDEKKTYRYEKACELYEDAIKLIPEDNLKETAELHFTLGETYECASYCAKTIEDAVRFFELSKRSYDTSRELFKRAGDDGRAFECSGLIDFIEASLSEDLKVAIGLFKKSAESFERAMEIYSQRKDEMGYSRALSRLFFDNSSLVFYQVKHDDILTVFEKTRPLMEEGWDILKKMDGLRVYPHLLFFIYGCAFWILGATMNLPKKYWSEEMYRAEEIGKELLALLEDSDDDLQLSLAYLLNSNIKYMFTLGMLEKEGERKIYFKQGVNYVDLGLPYAEKTGWNSNISYLYMNRYVLLSMGQLTMNLKEIFDDIDLSIRYEDLILPKFARVSHIVGSSVYTGVSLRTFLPQKERRSLAEKSLEILKEVVEETGLGTLTRSIPHDSILYTNYCWNYVFLAESSSEKEEQKKYIEKAVNAAEKAKEAVSDLKGGYNQSSAYSSLWTAFKSMANLTEDFEKKKEFLKIAVDYAERLLENPSAAMTGELATMRGTISARFILGDLYQELGILSKDEGSLKKAYLTFLEALKDSKRREYTYMVASTHQRLASVEENMDDRLSSAEHYQKASDTYKEALETLTSEKMIKKVEELCEYTRAWNLIELARLHHDREEYLLASEKYKEAGTVLFDLKNYKFESSYYSSWAKMEEAGQFSKDEMHKDAVDCFEAASESFSASANILNDKLKKTKDPKECERIIKLEKAARLRASYSKARARIERGRILGKEGKKLDAAKEYHKGASTFEEICTSYELDSGKEEYLAILSLCQAWESMELAEIENDPERFKKAAVLFDEASGIFSEKRMKLLALGNSSFCKALENGCKFDQVEEIKDKTELYSRTKMY